MKPAMRRRRINAGGAPARAVRSNVVSGPPGPQNAASFDLGGRNTAFADQCGADGDPVDEGDACDDIEGLKRDGFLQPELEHEDD